MAQINSFNKVKFDYIRHGAYLPLALLDNARGDWFPVSHVPRGQDNMLQAMYDL